MTLPQLVPKRIRHFIVPCRYQLVDFLADSVQLGQYQSLRLAAFGGVYVNCRRTLIDTTVFPGDYVRVHIQPKRFPVHTIDWSGTVFADTEDAVIVNKPAGIPIHPTLDNLEENTLRSISKLLRIPLFPTSRLDVATRGLVVFAKNQAFQSRFNALLREGLVEKRYRALTEQGVALGTHLHFMEPGSRIPKRMSTESSAGWMRCELEVEKTRSTASHHEISIRLITGRTHQIRAQLAALGSPIIGDVLYGGRCSHGRTPDAIGLVCWGLAFERQTYCLKR